VPAGGYKARIVQQRMVSFYKPVYIQNMERMEVPVEDDEVSFVKKRARMGKAHMPCASINFSQGHQQVIG